MSRIIHTSFRKLIRTTSEFRVPILRNCRNCLFFIDI